MRIRWHKLVTVETTSQDWVKAQLVISLLYATALIAFCLQVDGHLRSGIVPRLLLIAAVGELTLAAEYSYRKQVGVPPKIPEWWEIGSVVYPIVLVAFASAFGNISTSLGPLVVAGLTFYQWYATRGGINEQLRVTADPQITPIEPKLGAAANNG